MVGGAGLVGSLVVPLLRERLDLTVFDLVEPSMDVPRPGVGSRPCGITRPRCQATNFLLYMAMGATAEWERRGELANPLRCQRHRPAPGTPRTTAEVGIRHAVHVSTMSVYAQLLTRRIDDEGQPPDAVEFYGLSKRLGEDVCRAACREHGMSVNSLRICLPVSAEEWRRQFLAGTQTIHTEAGDVGRGRSWRRCGFGGFQAFHISGDWRERTMNLAKAHAMLGWNVYRRPVLLSPTAPAEFSMGHLSATSAGARLPARERRRTVRGRTAPRRRNVDGRRRDLAGRRPTSAHVGARRRVRDLGRSRRCGESYQEVHVTPNNHVLHLRFDDTGRARRIGGDLTLVAGAPDDVESSTARTATGWSVRGCHPRGRPPATCSGCRSAGCDASTALPAPVLSSSSPHPFVDFHRPSEWQVLRSNHPDADTARLASLQPASPLSAGCGGGAGCRS